MTKFRTTPITAAELTAEFMRLRRGSVTRRHFLGVTGLGVAAAVMGCSLGRGEGNRLERQWHGRFVYDQLVG